MLDLDGCVVSLLNVDPTDDPEGPLSRVEGPLDFLEKFRVVRIAEFLTAATGIRGYALS